MRLLWLVVRVERDARQLVAGLRAENAAEFGQALAERCAPIPIAGLDLVPLPFS